MSPLEKMARAIALRRYSESNPPEDAAKYAEEFLADYVPDARAALLAIREPDFSWSSEAVDHLAEPYIPFNPDPAQAFTAMIDAILNQEPRP